MLDIFINRQHFEYGIQSLDNLLKTEEIPESFLMYDEQILQILKAAGIPGPEAYATTKAIKKKKADKVAKEKVKFKDGFSKRLIETEGATEKKAEEIVEKIWTIIEDAANYMFCSAHSVSMAYDSLYVAWLKAHYPYELYVVMLKLYSEKKNKEKVSAIISEMKRYKGISLVSGRWGQDNRDWLVDKDKAEISQSLNSIRYVSKQTAEDLYSLSQQTEVCMGIEIINPKLNKEGKKRQKELKMEYDHAVARTDQGILTDAEMMDLAKRLDEEKAALYLNPDYLEVEYQEIEHRAKLDCFINVLRAIQLHTSINAREIRVLIELGYFSPFGKTAKLLTLQREFDEGKNRLDKGTKSFLVRLEALRQMEKELPDADMPLQLRLQSERENLGLCLTVDPSHNPSTYFVTEVDSKWGTTVSIYSAYNGKSGKVRFKKADLQRKPVSEGQMVKVLKGKWSPRYTYKGGQRAQVPGEKEYWVGQYEILKPA